MSKEKALEGADLQKQREAQEAQIILGALIKRHQQRKLFVAYGKVWNPEKPKELGAYPWQVEFHNAGATHTERLMMAANRVGKTMAAAAEVAIHLTGEYPPWWRGRRFEEPIQAWVGAETNEMLREVIQEHLLGPEGAYGTGWIPASRLVDKPRYRQAGVNNVVDQVFVKHVSGGVSTLTTKSFDQGVEKWRGKRLDLVWIDEEPDERLSVEARTRILDRRGILLMTATPHKGMTKVVRHFLEAKQGSGIYWKNVTWDDAPHLDKAAKEELWNSYPEHERETRARGQPMMGAGAVFPLNQDRIIIDPIPIQPWWARINGADFGINHPFGFAACAYDREADTFYVYDCYAARGETPAIHAVAMKKNGMWIPCSWPRDGLHRDKGSGQQLRNFYRQHGVYMLPEHATYKDERGEHVEPGLLEMYEYMRAGKFKVFKGVGEPFLEEMRMYHRDEDGKLVKERDDVISAVRYAFMMRRFARTDPGTSGMLAVNRPPSVPIAGRR